MPSRLLFLTPVEEALDEMSTRFEHVRDIDKAMEKMFLKYSKRGEVNNEEFENIELDKYYRIWLRMPPEFVGYQWIQSRTLPIVISKFTDVICRNQICPVSYSKTEYLQTNEGPLETSMGDFEELHFKLWIQRLQTKFTFHKRRTGTKRVDSDRIVRDYYESAEILDRCLKDNDSVLKYSILDGLYHKCTALHIFLLTEICEAQTKPNVVNESHEVRQDAYKYAMFLITALFMCRKTRDIVEQHREKERTGLAPNGEYGRDFLAFLDPSNMTDRSTLTTSATPSCSTQHVENVRVFRR